MQATRLFIQDVILFTPTVFVDGRGFFYESFNQQIFSQLTGLDCTFVQDNHSKSQLGVLRGLHYQLPPKAQGKLVRVISGEIFDVAVDIRKNSKTYGQWVGEILSSENKKQLWIPPGFAHGFVTQSETAEVLYKTTEYYSPEHERSIIWNDPDLAIDWKLKDTPIVSSRDALATEFRVAALFVSEEIDV